MIWVRARLTNGKEVWLQKRNAFFAFFLGGKGDIGFTDWVCLDNSVNRIENQIADKMGEVEDLLHQYANQVRMLEAEKSDIEKAAKTTRGFGPAYQLSDAKQYRDKKSKKVVAYVPKPDDDWRELISPRLLKKSLGNLAVKQQARKSKLPGAPKPPSGVSGDSSDGAFNPSSEGTTAYTWNSLDENAKNSVRDQAGADRVMGYREPNQNQQSNKKKRRGNNNQNNQNNQDNN